MGIFENKDKSKIQNDEEIDDLDFDEMNDVWDELDVQFVNIGRYINIVLSSVSEALFS